MSDDKPKAGERVIFVALPPGLLDDLPDEDQRAITAMVGRSARISELLDRGEQKAK
jgi:hypothetical protein